MSEGHKIVKINCLRGVKRVQAVGGGKIDKKLSEGGKEYTVFFEKIKSYVWRAPWMYH